MPKKKLPVLPIPMCNSDDCDKPALYGFRRIVDTTNSQSSAREFVSVPFNCCEEHLEETSKEFSGPNVKKVKF
jgi:hypothetical protein